MPVTDDLDPPQTLIRGVGYTQTTPPSPPTPPRLRRGPSASLPGDEWIRQFTARNEVHEPVTPRALFGLTPSSSGSWSTASTESYDEPPWWGSIPYRFRTDDFWNNMFEKDVFFLINEPIEPDKKEAIDTIMRLLSTGYKKMYNAASRNYTLKNPYPKVVNVEFVKQYLNQVRPLQLTQVDRYRFEMMIMNFLMFAPMEALEDYIGKLSRSGGTRRKRKHKSKRV
jgi:hypothetical protein